MGNANGSDWEYIRGAVWNDDPALLLFDDTSSSNRTYSLGATWYWNYHNAASEWANGAQGDMRNAAGRSHYGDLQFLHSMARMLNEPPTETKAKIMVWLEVMYKLAIGEDGITPETKVLATKLPQFCPPVSLPPSWKSLQYLLSKESPFAGLDIGRRAMGSMFHIIQDSYAIGHTQLQLLNPQDQIGQDLKFRDGVADQWGEIYVGQNDGAHAHYDTADDKLPDPEHLDNLDQWNGLVGCRSAVDKCIGLLKLKQAGKKWNEGVRQYFDQDVFAISASVTPANSSVGSG